MRIAKVMTESHKFLSRGKNYFPQLLNVHKVSDVRQMKIHTAEPLLPKPNHPEVEITIAK
jgi:hypothetical protein